MYCCSGKAMIMNTLRFRLATRLTLPEANTRQTNHFIQCEYFMRQITTFHKNLRQTSNILQASLTQIFYRAYSSDEFSFGQS